MAAVSKIAAVETTKAPTLAELITPAVKSYIGDRSARAWNASSANVLSHALNAILGGKLSGKGQVFAAFQRAGFSLDSSTSCPTWQGMTLEQHVAHTVLAIEATFAGEAAPVTERSPRRGPC